ncbi:MAG: hypothetical protein JAZ15_11840, partial [Candidatus Thiodiazotropha endolucinida]|nr:hypothetical protein [Candidatus Thiodiazotropha taylori]MCW4313713.1 hypothetical protein [Candidatus Thiodiazotropha taylori]
MSDSGWIKAVCAKTDQTRYPPKLADSWGNLALKPREITIQELFDRGEFDFLGHEGFWGYPDRVAAHDAFRGREPVPARIVDRFPRYKIVPGETFTNHSWTDKVVAALGYSSFKYHHKDLGHELVMGLTWPLNVLGKVVGWGIHYLNEELVDPLNSPYHGKSFEERFVHETVNIVDDWHHDFPGGMFDYEKNFEKYNKHQNVGNWLRGLGETIGLGSVIGAFDDENKNRSIFWKIVNVEEGLIQLILMVESFGALSKVFRAGGALTMDLATAYARTTEGLADSVARDLNFTSGALEPPAFEEPSLPARPKPPQKSEVDLVSTPKEQLSLEEKDQLYELRKKQKEIERQVLEQPPPLEPIEEGDEEGDDYFINNINAKYGSRVHPPQSELAPVPDLTEPVPDLTEPVPDLTEPVPDLTQKRRLSNQALFDDSRDVLGRAQAAESLADETLERMRQVSQE